MALQGTPVVQYPVDEAASGTTPTAVLDISGNGYHLTTVNYGSSTMAYTEVSGNRGLVSSSASGNHRASRAIDNTADALRTAMAGVQRATLEVKVNIGVGNASGGRVVVITDRAGGTGQFGLRQNGDADQWQLVFNGTGITFPVVGTTGLTLGNTHVLHVVLDTTQATQNDRVRICVNGGGSFIQVTNSITLNATLSLPSNLDLILLNRESSGSFARSVEGTIFYVALYPDALTLGQCQNNATDLAADDDPAGSAPPAPPVLETHDRTGTRANRPGRGPYSLGRFYVRTRLDAVPRGAEPTLIAAGVGAATAQGLAALVGVGTTISAGVGSAVASGLAAAISPATVIAAGVGSAAASGLQATITLPVVVAAGVGTAAAEGLPCTLALGTVVGAGVGVAAASGLAAQISVGTTIAAGVGVAAASGLAATIAPTTLVAAGVGTAAASGLAASIAPATVVSAAVGVAAASGLAATITQGNTISAGVGTAAASGLPAGIAVATPISAGVATAAAAGLQATIAPPTVISAGVAAAAASGMPATIVTATVIAGGVGAAQALGLGAQITAAGGPAPTFGPPTAVWATPEQVRRIGSTPI